jgi:hypothetical protein
VVLPQPLLTLDKISLTIDIPEDQRVALHWALLGDGAQQALARVARFWDGEVYHPSAPMGYKRAMVLKRDGEAFHMAFDPYRFTSRVLTPYEALSVRRLTDPLADADPDLDLDVREQTPINFLRVEFNPAKFPEADELLRRLVNTYVVVDRKRRANSWENWRSAISPTRVDAAVDYPVRKENFDLFLKRKRKSATFSSGGEVETTYYGKASGNQIRCYDKRKEQLARLMKVSDMDADVVARATVAMHDEPITRIEAQVRDLKNADGRKIRTAHELKRLVNPFRNMEVYGEMADGKMLKVVDDSSDWQDIAIASMIQVFGFQETLKRIPRTTAWRMRKRWQEDGTPIVHPSEVYAAEYMRVGQEVLPCLFSN